MAPACGMAAALFGTAGLLISEPGRFRAPQARGGNHLFPPPRRGSVKNAAECGLVLAFCGKEE